MANLNRTCIVCGQKYHYCPNCDNIKDDETWRNIYCSEDCHEVFRVVVDYKKKRMNARDSKLRLRFVNFDRRDSYVDDIKPTIDEIMSYQDDGEAEKPIAVKKNYGYRGGRHGKTERSYLVG